MPRIEVDGESRYIPRQNYDPKHWLVVIYKDGIKVKRSQLLQGILDYARISPVVEVHLLPPITEEWQEIEGACLAHFKFKDGAYCKLHFRDWKWIKNWVLKRRSWGVDPKVLLVTGE